MTAVSKYSPAPSDVYASMSQIIRQNNKIGVKNIRKLMMQDHPEWLISEKRLRALKSISNIVIPNAILIANPLMLLTSLDQIRSELQPLYLSNLTNDITDIPIIASALAQTDAQEVGRFYDRKPDICNWYYQCYCQIPCDQPNTHIPVRDSFAKWLDVRGVCGSFLIVKNGPSDGCWPNELNLDLDAVARTIWWYQASGNDRAQVCGEREFARFIKGL